MLDQKENNIEAFKEAWINSCIHSNWVKRRPPEVFWFDDRLEIMSYGGIPKGMTKKEFLAGKTNPVNEELMSIFLQCDSVEHSEHGVPVVDVNGLIQMKKKLGRENDLADIALIESDEKYLKKENV